MEFLLVCGLAWVVLRILRALRQAAVEPARVAVEALEAQSAAIEAARAELADMQSQVAGMRAILRDIGRDGGDERGGETPPVPPADPTPARPTVPSLSGP